MIPKIVAKDNDGKVWPIRVIIYRADGEIDFVHVNDDEQSMLYVPEEATIHLSTGMKDKNGREILVGDWVVMDDISERFCIITDGTHCYASFDDYSEKLTPELAATMEVVE